MTVFEDLPPGSVQRALRVERELRLARVRPDSGRRDAAAAGFAVVLFIVLCFLASLSPADPHSRVALAAGIAAGIVGAVALLGLRWAAHR